jgi:hypothetical protein
LAGLGREQAPWGVPGRQPCEGDRSDDQAEVAQRDVPEDVATVAVAGDAQDDLIGDDPAEPPCHDVGGDARKDQDAETGHDLDDTDAVHEALGSHAQEVREARSRRVCVPW